MIAGELAARARCRGRATGAMSAGLSGQPGQTENPLVQILQQAGLQILIVPPWIGAIVVGLMDASTEGRVWQGALLLTLPAWPDRAWHPSDFTAQGISLTIVPRPARCARMRVPGQIITYLVCGQTVERRAAGGFARARVLQLLRGSARTIIGARRRRPGSWRCRGWPEEGR